MTSAPSALVAATTRGDGPRDAVARGERAAAGDEDAAAGDGAADAAYSATRRSAAAGSRATTRTSAKSRTERQQPQVRAGLHARADDREHRRVLARERARGQRRARRPCAGR